VASEGEPVEIGVASAPPESIRARAWRSGNRDARAVAAVILVIAALGVAALAVVYGRGLARDPIRADAVGYYIYLPALFLDHDATLARTLARSPRSYSRASDFRRVQGRLLDKHQTGEAIMLAPFFAVGHLLAVATGASRDGFSWPYQAAAAAGGLVYALLGLAALGCVLLRWFGRGTVVATLLAITFGTDLFHYATYEAVYSHAFSFALAALVVRATFGLRDRPRVAAAALLGSSLGLSAAVRTTNLVLVLFALLVGVHGLRDLVDPLRASRRRPALLAAGAVGFAIPLIPQVLYWHALTGHFVVNAYGSTPKLDLLHPHLLDVAFSVRKGVFFWSPLLVLAVLGVPLLRRAAPGLVLPVATLLVLDFWIVSSWTEWWYGGSFGAREFVDVLPVYALGLAALLAPARGTIRRWAVGAAVAATSLVTAHAMAEYWLGNIPFDQTTWQLYLHSFGKI
jgi:hypothetical protein